MTRRENINRSIPAVLPRPVQAVIFDMDGLLIDSETVVRDAMMRVAKELGRELPVSVFLRMVGLPAEQGRAVAIAHFGTDFPIDDFTAAVLNIVQVESAAGIALKSGVIEILDHLDIVGLPRAIATSSQHASVTLHLDHAGILSRFQAVVAAGDYARGKPYPDPFLKAAERLGVDPAYCLALEDSHNGVRAAHAAGMMTVMVPDLLEPTAEMRSLCITIADTLHAVIGLLPSTNGAAGG